MLFVTHLRCIINSVYNRKPLQRNLDTRFFLDASFVVNLFKLNLAQIVCRSSQPFEMRISPYSHTLCISSITAYRAV